MYNIRLEQTAGKSRFFVDIIEARSDVGRFSGEALGKKNINESIYKLVWK